MYIDEDVHIDQGEDDGLYNVDYETNRYHKPADEYDDSWGLRGAVEDFQLMFVTGFRVADSDQSSDWKEGTEFKARREADIGL